MIRILKVAFDLFWELLANVLGFTFLIFLLLSCIIGAYYLIGVIYEPVKKTPDTQRPVRVALPRVPPTL